MKLIKLFVFLLLCESSILLNCSEPKIELEIELTEELLYKELDFDESFQYLSSIPQNERNYNGILNFFHNVSNEITTIFEDLIKNKDNINSQEIKEKCKKLMMLHANAFKESEALLEIPNNQSLHPILSNRLCADRKIFMKQTIVFQWIFHESYDNK